MNMNVHVLVFIRLNHTGKIIEYTHYLGLNICFFRRNSYRLNNCSYGDTSPYPNETNLYSMNHISIHGNIGTKDNSIYFPNVTELTVFDYSNRTLHSISTIFDRFIPLIKLSKLSIYSHHICITQLIYLLYFSPNIHTLTINSISLSKISCTSNVTNEKYDHFRFG